MFGEPLLARCSSLLIFPHLCASVVFFCPRLSTYESTCNCSISGVSFIHTPPLKLALVPFASAFLTRGNMRPSFLNSFLLLFCLLVISCDDLGEVFIPPLPPPELIYDTRQDEVYQMGSDGSNKVLVPGLAGSGVQCSNDGRWIATYRFYPPVWLVLYERSTMLTKKVAITITENVSGTVSFSWSPDGTKLAFIKGLGGFYETSLCVVDTGGFAIRELTNTGNNFDPRWSPDGRTISFFKNESQRKKLVAYLINTDGSNMLLAPYLPFGRCTPVEWSPGRSSCCFREYARYGWT